jgi:glycine oxidase
MLSPGGEFDQPSRWLDLGIESLRLYPAFVDELRSETGLPIDFRLCGCLALAMNDEERSDARRRAAFQSSVGIRVELTSRGLLYPDDGFVDPTDLVRALRCALEARKVAIMEHQPIEEIEADDYAAVVIAAGAWSGGIRVLHRKQLLSLPGTIPVKGHLIGFELEPGMLGTMLRSGHTYVLQRSNGFTIAGSTEERVGFARAVDSTICADIQRRAAKLFPPLERATPSKQWIGFRPYAAGGPHIERLGESNVWLAYGHFRNGILLAPVTSERIAAGISCAVKC